METLKRTSYFEQTLFCLIFFLSVIQSSRSQISFSQSNLNFNGTGNVSGGVTGMSFGPDNRLYVVEYTGAIKILTVNRNSATNYSVTAVEVLNGITTIQNHNDDGTSFTTNKRETIGIVVGGTALNPVFYVSSSDIRIGAGSNGGNGDLGLDTNSGIITRFSRNGSTWDVVDIVRGLPRSEENHAPNGLQLATINGTNHLIVNVGGITNGGSPSTNFVYTCEYALSAAVLSIDLDKLNALPILNDNGRNYIYDLPTLDDPTRPNSNSIVDPDTLGYDGKDINDPFGGNDGLNMAIIVPNGPVQILSAGYRNAYGVVVTESGALYVSDNGANQGWGGFPVNEGTANVTNNYNPSQPGDTSPSGGEVINNIDHLQLVTTNLNNYTFNSFYGGHPNPVRANPQGAGLYTDNFSALGTFGLPIWRTKIYDPNGSRPNSTTNPNEGLPANWPPVQISNSVEGDWRGPGIINPDGPNDNPVVTWGTNTNSIDEYTASNFGGALKGNLLAGHNGGNIRKVILSPDGRSGSLEPNFFSGIGGDVLGLTCNGDNDIFPGTVWAGTINGKIVVMEPLTPNFVCLQPGNVNYNPLADYDSDGYTNQDEVVNGTDHCNGGSQPSDFDKIKGAPFISDRNDLDDDSDGIPDSVDPFQLGNPLGTGSQSFTIPLSNDFFNNQQGLGGIFGLGMTGLMNNEDTGLNWLNWIDRRDNPNDPNPNDVMGGAPGIITAHMTSGTALGLSNSQEKGYQYGVQVDSSSDSFTVIGGMNGFSGGPYRLYGNQAAIGGELGFFIGDGTQSNYIKFVVTVNGFTVLQEINDVPQAPINVSLAVINRPSDSIRFYFTVNPQSGSVKLEYSLDSNPRVTVTTVTAQGKILEALQLTNKDLAVGIIGTSGVSGVELEGSWDFLNVISAKPVVILALPDINRTVGANPESINLNSYFSNVSGSDALIYTIINNTNNSIVATIANNTLNLIFPTIIPASSIITIRATDANNNFVEQSFTVNIVANSLWIDKNENENYTARHENSFVQAGNKFYLMGGRENAKTIDVYDYTSNTWTALVNSAPFEFNHFQATEYKGLIWVIGAFQTNLYPTESPAEYIWSFDPSSNEWIQGPQIPVNRRRGSAGLAVYNDKFYILAGNTIGHDGGYVNWFDQYNPATGTWTVLADAPRARDHFHATVVGNKLYAIGGRLSGGAGGVFKPVIPQVDVYDFTNNSWSTLPINQNLPTPRAAAMVANYNGKLLVIGGEVQNELVYGVDTDAALKITEQYDPATQTWSRIADLNYERHGTQAIVSGSGIFTLAGSPNRGGGNQKNMEVFGTDLPIGNELVASNLSAPSSIEILGGGSKQIMLDISGGNVGKIIKSMQLTGPNAADFSIVSGLLTNALLNANSTHNIVVQSNNNLENKSAILTISYGASSSVIITVTSGPPPVNNFVLRINAGGPAVSNSGILFEADKNFTGGRSYTNNLAQVPTLYKTERSSNSQTFGYNIPVTNGAYNVVLHFAEIYWGATGGGPSGIGRRRFDVTMEGVLILNNYDIFADVGAQTAVTKSYPVTITDGTLTLSFSSLASVGGVDQPKLSALEILGTSNPTVNQAPVAVSSATPLTGTAPLAVNFTGSNSTDDVAITSFLWDFGDGSPTVTTMSPSHIFTTAGVYNVLLRVQDEAGLTNTSTVVITVTNPTVNQAPVAVATASPLTGTAPIVVNFTGSNSTDDVAITGYLWNFGDGSATVSTANPTHTYSNSGTYTAVLTVTDAGGLQNTKSVIITVTSGPPPVNNFVLRINAGGPAVTNSGILFEADKNFTGGRSVTNNLAQISQLYRSERSSPSLTFSYNIPLANGNYTIVLHFAEIYWGATGGGPSGIGRRKFDVTMEGALILDNYDIFAEVGAQKAVTKSYPVTVTDGILNLSFSSLASVGGVDQPKLSALEILGTSNPTVNQAPVAISSATPLAGAAPLAVNFTGSNSTDDIAITSFLWDFGDGSPAVNTISPSHIFTTAGVYNVLLRVQDGAGLTNTSTVVITVANPTVNQAPVAVATASPLTGTAPLAVNFTGSDSTDDIAITSFLWDFGDGSPTTNTISPSHIFTTAGVYNVLLRVQDGAGLTNTSTVVITVANPTVNQAPVAVATASPLTGTAPLAVNFTGSNSTDDAAITGYLWNFGDGSATVSTANPTHTYSNFGTYTAELTVTDAGGLQNTSSALITVTLGNNQAPVAVATASPLTGTAPLAVNFTGSESTDDIAITSFLWDFGDGSPIANTISSSHIFTTAGVYNVLLRVQDGAGLTNTSTVVITVANPTVNQAPVAVATASPLTGTAPLAVNFTGSNSTDDAAITGYLWNFGDGSATVSTANPTHTYSNFGTYTAELTVTDAGGLQNTSSALITVTLGNNQAPVAVATASPLTGTAPLAVNFTGSNSTDDVAITGYLWNFGDGSATVSAANPTHIYSNSGIYTAELTVTDIGGLQNTKSVIITVTSEPPPVNNFVLRINAGGPAVTNSGILFEADKNFTGGRSYTNNSAQVPTLYKTERSSFSLTFGYNIPLANGNYTIVLHFAEIYWGAGGGPSSIGRRKFDVTMEGVLILDNYDIFADVGAQTAVTKSFPVTVTDGILNLSFSSLTSVGGADQPKLSALEILGLGSSPTSKIIVSSTKTADNESTLSLESVIDNLRIDPNEIRLFSNPTNYEVNIVTGANVTEINTIELFDMTGKLLSIYNAKDISIGTGHFKLNVESLEEGSYFIICKTKSGKSYSKQLLTKK